MDCACSDSEFKDIDHGHIVTGNLHIIKNKRLRGLFRKGPNYREKETLNWKKAFDSLKEDINSFIEKWNAKICKPKEYFYEWKIKLLELIQTRGKSLIEEENQMQTSEESVERPRLSERTEET